MTTAQFWKQQEFSYLVTFSFNRGPKLDALRGAAKELFQQTRSSLLTAKTQQLPALREQLRLLERTHNLDLLTLTPGPAAFHVTASPISKLENNVEAIQKIASILQRSVIQQYHWMCGPVYRDALAFYNVQNELTNVLNICFSCDQMVTAGGQQIEADASTYKALRACLVQLGHPIAEEER
ncbi:hypothetical protein GCM10023172_08980 [Hymenobacter ginsengisoli]|uniref:Uncharacterized protein n=1 Tax=Hymenobacter ginsengisoli TaxID=1051626 RepID=A0ABP8Q4M3_9BACT|nr:MULTISPECIES: hypothetical protein [unclassified Hymenobacter]MBO2032527.1 hypothetical protein [Hymenobacter sp. BT559]